MLLQGGMHGDEINGVEILRRMISLNEFEIEAGRVIVIPLLNIYGFLHFSRDVPDGKDVNRSFPGHKNGSLASRVVWNLMQYIFPHVDIAIDLHTGGGRRNNHPQIRYTAQSQASYELAKNICRTFCDAFGVDSQEFSQ